MSGVDRNSPHNRTYNIFLGLQFISKNKYYKRSEIIRLADKAIKLAQSKLRKTFPKVKLKLQHELTLFGRPVNSQIVAMVKTSSAGLFEVSERNPNVYFELGLIYSKRNTDPLIMLNTRAAKKKIIASDVQDLFRLQYKQNKLEDKINEIANHISDQIARQIRVNRYDVRRIWGGGSRLREITVICPTLPTAYLPAHARRSSSEFVNLAKYGDPDALVETLILLRTLYPNIKIERYTSKEIRNTRLRKNLIIIGGPDFNKFTKDFMKSCPIQYKVNQDQVAFVDKQTNKVYELKERRRGNEISDYGLFARFPNPNDTSKTVIMLGGLGTFGVVCAAEAFGLNTTSKRNTRIIIDKVSENPFFVSLIPIQVSGSQMPLCNIDVETVYKYPWC